LADKIKALTFATPIKKGSEIKA